MKTRGSTLKKTNWRLAKSLEKLLVEVNKAFPNRKKTSDGTIGDAAHKRRNSDHNPNANGVVCGLDLTHDPENGFDAHAFAEKLIAHPHPNLDYIISNRRIWSRIYDFKLRPYRGSNPHDKHIHISVGFPWGLSGRKRINYDDPFKDWIVEPEPREKASPDGRLFVNNLPLPNVYPPVLMDIAKLLQQTGNEYGIVARVIQKDGKTKLFVRAKARG